MDASELYDCFVVLFYVFLFSILFFRALVKTVIKMEQLNRGPFRNRKSKRKLPELQQPKEPEV